MTNTKDILGKKIEEELVEFDSIVSANPELKKHVSSILLMKGMRKDVINKRSGVSGLVKSKVASKMDSKEVTTLSVNESVDEAENKEEEEERNANETLMVSDNGSR